MFILERVCPQSNIGVFLLHFISAENCLHFPFKLKKFTKLFLGLHHPGDWRWPGSHGLQLQPLPGGSHLRGP